MNFHPLKDLASLNFKWFLRIIRQYLPNTWCMYLDYHNNYIMAEEEAGGAGGNGIEIHGFHHMDCPLDDKSGYFILGKWNAEDELHLTGRSLLVWHLLLLVLPLSIPTLCFVCLWWSVLCLSFCISPSVYISLSAYVRIVLIAAYEYWYLATDELNIWCGNPL